eukprot:100486-Prorocentrum_lima.AAC.1
MMLVAPPSAHVGALLGTTLLGLSRLLVKNNWPVLRPPYLPRATRPRHPPAVSGRHEADRD